MQMIKLKPTILLELFYVIAIFGCGLMGPSREEFEQIHIELLNHGYQIAQQKDDLDGWIVFWNTDYKSWCLDADPHSGELIQLCNSYKQELSQKLTSHYIERRKHLPELVYKTIPFDPFKPLPSDAEIAKILLKNSSRIVLYVFPTDRISGIDIKNIVIDALTSKGYHVDPSEMADYTDTAFVSIYHRVDSTIPQGAKSWLSVRDKIEYHGDYRNSGYSMLVKVCTDNPFVCYSTREETEQKKHRASKKEIGSYEVTSSAGTKFKETKYQIHFEYTENMRDCIKRLVDRIFPSRLP